ncbi:MAG: translation elongation factor Ts [Acidaminococcaceae bacterium]|jgi:elongation factor Ts|nr:translation elongation factor Ts [Acidaminococcaceae bacterium]
MAQITAALVKTLRERTGAGMMDCKKALSACEGDLDKAVDFLREKGLSQAAKKASRVAAEGAVAAYVSEDAKTGVIVEVNCETDFVAKTDDFQALAHTIAEHIAKTNPKDVEALKESTLNGKKVADLVTEKVAKIGENISLRRFVRYEVQEGLIAYYIHAGGKIGVLVDLNGGDAALGKDIAMQVAATNPAYLNRTQVPADVLEHEKEVLSEQAKNEGKPEKIIEKMVMGRIQKYYKENCLVDQEFVKDPDQSITKLLKAHNAEIRAYARFQLGEGIEKKQENFADEVKSFLK